MRYQTGFRIVLVPSDVIRCRVNCARVITRVIGHGPATKQRMREKITDIRQAQRRRVNFWASLALVLKNLPPSS